MGGIRAKAQANIARPEKGLTSDRSFITRNLVEPRKEEKQMNTGSILVCAPSGTEVAWHSIDWSKCHQNVRRLQARIVKATKEGNWGKVKALQWLLTHSLSGKAIAVKRVTENRGKKTPGVDGQLWSTPEAKSAAMLSLKRRGYKPLPSKRVYIPKSNGKLRPLGIPTMRDRAMEALHLLALDPVSETLADKNSYGFRKGRSTHDAIEQCFTVLGKGKSPKWVLEGDIKGCFDNISHEWMISNIPTDKEILRKWLKAGYVEKAKMFPTEAGTPQGGIISPALANMVLDGLEKRLNDTIRVRKSGGNVVFNPMVNLVRYADDFIVTGNSKETLEKVRVVVAAFLEERGLTLSPEKTRIVHIEEGFDFLGQNVRMYGNKLLIKPSKESISRLLSNIRQVIRENKTAKQENLIGLLNPLIRGWVNYHKHVVSAETFHRLDYMIWQTLWQWAVRRHRNKMARWIRRKYFQPIKTRTWTFACDTEKTTENGKPKMMKLVYAGDTKIKRHVKVIAEANPYDPAWEAYFEQKLARSMVDKLKGKGRLLRLWLAQDGICPECGEKLTKDTGWNIHHSIYRVYGGSSCISNLRLLHPNCHRKHHSRNPIVAGFAHCES
jgi:RNA-directed DNA polymerase